MFGIDLHVHTDASPDGDIPVDEIFKEADESGLRVLSITDHNDTSALARAEELAIKYNIKFIPGVEFNSNFNGRDIHILGYFIDSKSEKISRIIEEIKSRKEEQARARVKKLQELGFFIEYDDAVRAARGMVPNGSIFYDALVKNKRNRDNPTLRRYIDGDRSDSPHFNFYRDFFRYGKPAYIPLTHVETEKVVEILLTAGALPVLAHPYDIPEAEIKKIINNGIVGIEAYSSYHSEEQNKHFVKMAEEYNLIITAGSDFHGRHKPKVKLGIFLRDGKEIVDRVFAWKEKCKVR